MRSQDLISKRFRHVLYGYDMEQVDGFILEAIHVLERYEAQQNAVEWFMCVEELCKRIQNEQRGYEQSAESDPGADARPLQWLVITR